MQDGNDETFNDATHYVAVNDVIVRNAWQTIYEFGEDVKQAVATTNAVKKQVEGALPTLNSAEAKLKALVKDAETKIGTASSEAQKTIDSALADVAGVTAGFGFKEVQW